MTKFMTLTVAATALFIGYSSAHAQLEGTLFTTPEQREYLDYLRAEFLAQNLEEGFDFDATAVPEIPDAATEAQEPQIYAFGGIMERKDGSHTIWLNQKALTEQQLPSFMHIIKVAGALVLQVNNENASYVLRPGQTLDYGTGIINENMKVAREAAEAAKALEEANTPKPGLVDTMMADVGTVLDLASEIGATQTPEEDAKANEAPASDESELSDPAEIIKLLQQVQGSLNAP